MLKLTSKQIRQMWIDFFKEKNHYYLPSASLVPINDPSLLWINSGVATLKDYFSGIKVPPSLRLVNSQKSIRTNDIENVGVTARHHTFFEMLGNFSIGDYFKKEAQKWALEFLLDTLKIDLDKLYFTVFEEDEDAYQIWLDLGIEKNRIIKGTRKTNFWDVGLGPCGPNSEIFYDRGEKYDPEKVGLKLLKEDLENDRYIEIWNLVFSTFNNDGKNNYTPLKSKNIDTGAGFERLVSISQNAPTNYDTDLFLPIIAKIEELNNKKYVIENYFDNEPVQKEINTAFRVIADHMRSSVNAIADGVEPSNVGRGYIIRRLIRRSYRMGIRLGIKSQTFLHKLVQAIHDALIFDYDIDKVSKIIEEEEILFSKTIDAGLKILEKELERTNNKIDFAFAWKLFETYGYPIELTQEILREKNIYLDISEFEKYREMHVERSRSKKGVAMKNVVNSLADIKSKIGEFIGYENLNSTSKILFLANQENEIDEINGEAFLVLDKTPFYATSGGQKHDQGYLQQGEEKIEVYEVFKDKFGNHVHHVKGKINKAKSIDAFVDPDNRVNLERNHSSTHLLFKALREVFGSEIKQLGSNNNENRLTFDMPANKKPSAEKIAEVERLVRHYIDLDVTRTYSNTDVENARKMGVIITIEETEYMDPSNVRVVSFKNITSDLCGGTHISNTARIENFKITSVENKGTGIFRVTAVTTHKLVDKFNQSRLEKIKEEIARLKKNILEYESHFKFKKIEEDDLELLIDCLIKYSEELKESLKTVIKNNSKKVDDKINVKNYTKNDQLFIINLDVDDSIITNQAAALRKQNKTAVVLLSSNKNPNSNKFVITSEEKDVKQIWNDLAKNLKIRGGGNERMMQGVILEKPNYEKIEELL
ncbi:alanine--tRNA ligase [Mycoplasmopsis agassizii]|uniref:Alanine--tRNA ligase n=1 Tax=Mycoplasmopsis agassizii TaxID=33922 RepID=A0ABX4H459_9BACT|nr:alanine--tRNA ligase [Mycoplasmopsis agassizii]PAF54677.1 alanine--tRNA ligase [Mycoplasmopsis agassizii]SMC16079.1 alanyl-tRNA synthetase [Mycoplasmopsis agassizii]